MKIHCQPKNLRGEPSVSSGLGSRRRAWPPKVLLHGGPAALVICWKPAGRGDSAKRLQEIVRVGRIRTRPRRGARHADQAVGE